MQKQVKQNWTFDLEEPGIRQRIMAYSHRFRRTLLEAEQLSRAHIMKQIQITINI